MSQNNPTIIHVGVDVAKLTLQLDPTHLAGLSQVANTPAGLKTLLKALRKLQCRTAATVHVLCEATGCYHRLLLEALHQAGIAISVLHAARVRAFAEALGQRAKSDPIDAVMLTRFGQRLQPAPTVPATEQQQHLSALMTRRTQLVDMLVMEKNRMESSSLPEVIKQLRQTIKHLESQMAKMDAAITKLATQSEKLQQQIERMCQLQGVGKITATGLLATLPELGTLGRRQIASLAGLAPHVRESGQYKGKRTIGGGRASARRHLYMAALTASRMNPQLKTFYQHLIAKGKPAKVALTAIMRRLLCVLNSLLKNPNFSLA
jgi:transposase